MVLHLGRQLHSLITGRALSLSRSKLKIQQLMTQRASRLLPLTDHCDQQCLFVFCEGNGINEHYPNVFVQLTTR